MFEEWVDEVCTALGIEDAVDVDLVLEVARDVAHGVERRAAPVTTFLIGLAAGRATDRATASATLATRVQELASNWTASGQASRE
jgi:hypothetical protein